MQETGQHYPKDDRTDPSVLLRRARLHQSIFSAKYLDLSFDTHCNYLTKDDGENCKNFYDGLGISDAVKGFSKITTECVSNTTVSSVDTTVCNEIWIDLENVANYLCCG